MDYNEENISFEASFVKGSKGQATADYQDVTKPLVVRGIVKRKPILECEKINRDYFYIDTGYFGNFVSPGNTSGRKVWHRVVKNNLQHTEIQNHKFDRWEYLVSLDPKLKWQGWKRFNKKILLVMPNPKACNFYGIDIEQWKQNTIATIQKHTDLPIEIREKGSRSFRNTVYTIYDALNSGVHATVVFNSIAAIESICYGVPAFVSVPCAASPLASTNLNDIMTPYYPDENKILNHCATLAYGQFTVQELLDGTAWKLSK